MEMAVRASSLILATKRLSTTLYSACTSIDAIRGRVKAEEASASEPEAQEQQPEKALSPEILEAIRENTERQEKKENALRTIAEAKRIEELLVGKDRSSDDGYTYNSDE